MSRSFLAELQRRKVIRVAIAYTVTAWLIAQVAGLAADSFQAPGWVMKMLITLLLLGLPVALIMAWAYDMTPDGLRRESVDSDGATDRATNTRTLDRIITFVLVLALAYFAYDKFVLDPARDQAMLEAAVAQSGEAPSEATPPENSQQPDVPSVAVLPFLNMSEDADNEYFADGLSEELLNLLVRKSRLRVAARTSSFSFKGKDVKISDIARELNVGHILEGSVRKSGDQLRIAAQLVNAEDGFPLWSETFDRKMDEIFVIQDEIAQKVAQALEVTLLGDSRAAPDVDPESYAAYLRGLHFLRQRGPDNVRRSADFFKEAVELDPNNAAAWSTLAFAYADQISFGILSREEFMPIVESALEHARRLDPGNAINRAAEGYIRKNLFWDWRGAQAAIASAHKIDPHSQPIRGWHASTLTSLGELDEAIRIYEGILATDPLSLSVHSALGIAYTKVHRYDDAVRIFAKQLELNPNYHWAHSNMGKAWLFKGDATRALEEINRNPDNIFKAASLPVVYYSLGRHAESDAAMQALIAEHGDAGGAFFIATAFSWRGDKDEAFEWLEKAYRERSGSIAYMLGENLLYPLLDDPRWPAFLEKVGLLEYWQAMPEEYGGVTQ